MRLCLIRIYSEEFFMKFKWEDIYSQFEKIRVKKHISILKNTRVNNVIVSFINEKYIDIYDFVPTTLYSKNKKQILSNVIRIKKYLIANPNIYALFYVFIIY